MASAALLEEEGVFLSYTMLMYPTVASLWMEILFKAAQCECRGPESRQPKHQACNMETRTAAPCRCTTAFARVSLNPLVISRAFDLIASVTAALGLARTW